MAKQVCYERWEHLFTSMEHNLVEASIHQWTLNGQLKEECQICGESYRTWYEEVQEKINDWELREGDYLSKDG